MGHKALTPWLCPSTGYLLFRDFALNQAEEAKPLMEFYEEVRPRGQEGAGSTTRCLQTPPIHGVPGAPKGDRALGPRDLVATGASQQDVAPGGAGVAFPRVLDPGDPPPWAACALRGAEPRGERCAMGAVPSPDQEVREAGLGGGASLPEPPHL